VELTPVATSFQYICVVLQEATDTKPDHMDAPIHASRASRPETRNRRVEGARVEASLERMNVWQRNDVDPPPWQSRVKASLENSLWGARADAMDKKNKQ